MKFLTLQKLFFTLAMILTSVLVFAQPANDDCSTPTLMTLGADAASCVLVAGDTRGTVDATMIAAPEVCSGSWFSDDVWFSFETGAVAPANGVTIEVRLDASSGTELIEHGMALYLDCDAESMAIDCFTDAPGRRTIDFPRTCMEPNATYLVRVWSAPEPTLNEGTFAICAYETPPDTTGPEPMARIIYEETFDKGFNGWESISQTQSLDINTGEIVDDNWMWTNTGCFTTAFGGSACLTEAETACMEAGVVGIPAGFYQSERDGDPGNIPPTGPYPNVNTFIVSPPIDLSKESCVNLTWNESARFLSGGALSALGSYVQYSLDDGETWINPSQAIGTADVSTNYGASYIVNAAPTNALERSIPLIGAEGNTNVRLRFGFDGTFYFWIVDNIRIVEGVTADGIAQNNFFARAPINPMSVHMVDSYDFLIDIANLSCEDLTNVNVNMNITNNAGEEMHNVNLAYGTIMADSLAENQPFLQPFTPPAVADDYTATYTLSADRDDDPSNNVITFQASVVDEMVFRKENGNPNGALAPNQNPGVFWEEDEAFAWEMGNMFFAPRATSLAGERLQFTTVSFQLANPEAIIGDLLRIWIYEVSDNDFDNIISKNDSSELTRLGISEYTVTGTENGLITVQLESFIAGEELIELKPITHYMASIETTTEVVRDEAMAIADDDTYDYSAAIFNAQQTALATGDLTQNRYSHSFAISKENYFRIGPGNSGDITTGNFNQSSTPVIRLGFEEIIIIPTVEVNQDIKISVSPNPTAANLTLNLSVAEAIDMDISIVNIAGSVIFAKSFQSITDLKEEFDLSDLPNGIYMVHINTENGVQTEKFVISK